MVAPSLGRERYCPGALLPRTPSPCVDSPDYLQLVCYRLLVVPIGSSGPSRRLSFSATGILPAGRVQSASDLGFQPESHP